MSALECKKMSNAASQEHEHERGFSGGNVATAAELASSTKSMASCQQWVEAKTRHLNIVTALKIAMTIKSLVAKMKMK